MAQADPEAQGEGQEGGARAEQDTEQSKGSESPPAAASAKDSGSAKPEAGPPGKAIDLAYQLKVWEVVNGSAPRINDCLDRYLAVQSKASGMVELALEVSGEGRMVKVGTKSALPASEKLQQCLKFIAQSWRFPSMEGVEKLSTGLQIKAAKGQKFTLTKPGEKPPERKPSEPKTEDSGFLGFSPGWGTGFYR